MPRGTININGKAVVIHTEYWAKPVPFRDHDWSAVDDNYDGADDSATRSQVGYGATEHAAIADLKIQLEDAA